MNVGQAEISPGVAVCQALVVQAELVQDRGLQIVDVDRVLDDVKAQFVGLTVRESTSSHRRRPSTS